MRILQITTSYHGGGAERCSRELFHALQQRGHDVQMWVGYLNRKEPPGVRTIRLPKEPIVSLLNLLPGVFDWRYLGSKLALTAEHTRPFDVVHLHNIHTQWISIKSVAALCKRQPVVWTLHDEWATSGGMPYDLSRVVPIEEAKRLAAASTFPSWLPLHPSPWATRWRRFLETHMPKPNGLITPSNWMKHLAQQAPWFTQTPVQTIYNGVSLLDEPAIEQTQAQARAKTGIPTDRPCILLVAASMTSPYKSMHLAVDALLKLATDCRPSTGLPSIMLLGKDTSHMASQLRQQAGYHVAESYASNNTELANAYRSADMTLIPSIVDNFPYVGLESLTCQTPIICFDTGGLPEIAGHGQQGAVIPRFDTHAMAMTLAQWVDNPALAAKLGMQGKQWVRHNMNFDDYTKRVISAYDTAINAHIKTI